MTSHHSNIETPGVVGTGALVARTPLTIPRNTHVVPCDRPVARRPSRWRVRRAKPGLSLTLPEASDTADINASNEAPQ